MTYYAMLLSPESAEACSYEGPFYSEQEASDFADSANDRLADQGLPALWSVV